MCHHCTITAPYYLTGKSYVFIASPRGILQAVDVTNKMPGSASAEATPGTVIAPLMLEKSGDPAKKSQTPGFTAGGLEGETPVVVAGVD